MALAREMPVAVIAGLVAEHDTRLWRSLRHYVAQAHAEQDWSTVTAVAIDETATRKGRIRHPCPHCTKLDFAGQTTSAGRLTGLPPCEEFEAEHSVSTSANSATRVRIREFFETARTGRCHNKLLGLPPIM